MATVGPRVHATPEAPEGPAPTEAEAPPPAQAVSDLAGDWWENFENRPLRPVMDRLVAEADGLAPYCHQELMVGSTPYVCTRSPYHPGRHIARASHMICAAWPGDLPPTLGDLDDLL